MNFDKSQKSLHMKGADAYKKSITKYISSVNEAKELTPILKEIC